MKVVRVWNETKGIMLCDTVLMAHGFFSRLRGLIGRSDLSPDQGMYIEPCSAIHTFFMSFPIDCAFLDDERTIVEVRHSLAPFRAAGPVRKARGVLELAAGRLSATGTDRGNRLIFEQFE